MRAISIIFRRELSTYFSSWVGYVVGALALLVAGLVFQTFALDDKARLSADILSYFFQLMSVASLAIGIILSIRLIAEERQQNTLVLLKTSPVRDVEIVIGKYLAAFVFMTLIVCASVYIPMLIKVNGKISMEQIYVGYLGLVLLGGTGLAIGMFASALARHQLVALAIGVFLAFLMSMCFKLAGVLDAPLKEVIAEVDIWWRWTPLGPSSFANGILNLSDIVLYGAMIYFFLLLSTKTLEAKRWR